MSDFTKQDLRIIVDEYKAKYGVVSPSFLRSEIAITDNGMSKAQFQILNPNSVSDRKTEKKLDRNDDFLITELGIFLMKEDSTGMYIQKKFSYIDPVVFADNSTTFVGSHLASIYLGRLRMIANTKVLVDGLPGDQFLKEPSRQQSAGAYYAINAAGAEATASVLAAAQKKLMIENNESDPNNGFLQVVPQYLIHGKDTLELYHEFPNNGALKIKHTTSNQVNFIVFEARGYLLQLPKNPVASR